MRIKTDPCKLYDATSVELAIFDLLSAISYQINRLVIDNPSSRTTMTKQQAFTTPTLPNHRTRHQNRRHRPTCKIPFPEPVRPNQTRRRLLLLPLLPLLPRPTRSASLSENVAPILMCRKIMSPVSRYIEEGSWDKGRTNVNYCTRILALRRNMRDSASLLQGDAYYDALDIMGELDNTMTQLDASLYTPLFIPADDGISVEQRKYQTQARGFYNEAITLLDGYIQLIPPSVLQEARERVAKTAYQIRFEDE